MPARVLRQLLPWLSSCLGASAARELVGDACVGAGPRGEQRAEARLLRSWCDGLEALEEEEGELELLLSLLSPSFFRRRGLFSRARWSPRSAARPRATSSTWRTSREGEEKREGKKL